MAVKILVGMDNSDVQKELDKTKTGWKENEKAADDFAKAVDKGEKRMIAYGKNLVKQNRTAEKALKDRIDAVRAAARAGEISAAEEKRTVDELKRKHEEAGRKAVEAAERGTLAYKEKQRQVQLGKKEVERITRATQTLEQRYDELRVAITQAWKAGEISTDDYRQSLKQLDVEQAKVKKGRLFGNEMLGQVSSYAAGVVSVSTAIAAVQKAFSNYVEEVKKGRDETVSLRNVRTSLIQVSDETNFSQRLRAVDDAAIQFGVKRDKSAEALFDAISNEVEADFKDILRADRIIPSDIGAKFVGEFRKVFESENLTANQALNLGLAAAGTSKFNVQEIQPQIRTAAQGSALLPGVEASDVAAFVSVLGSQFGDRTGTYVRAIQANIGAELINQQDALKAATTDEERSIAQKNISLLSGSLPDIVQGLKENKELRDKITAGNKEVLTGFTVAAERLNQIRSVDQTIEQEVKKAGTSDSLISKRLRAFFSDATLALDFQNQVQETSRAVSAERRFSAGEAIRQARTNELNAKLNSSGAGFIERAVSTGILGVGNFVQSATGLGESADVKAQSKRALEQVETMINQGARTNELLEQMAGNRALSDPRQDR